MIKNTNLVKQNNIMKRTPRINQGKATRKSLDEKECVVCFDNVTDYIQCHMKTCETAICVPCMAEYLQLSLTEKSIPKCPNTTCERYYLISCLGNRDELISVYNDCCLFDLISEKGNDVRKLSEIADNIKKLRHARQVFIAEKFPPAIAHTATKYMPTKLKKLDQQLTEKITSQTKFSKRRCMNNVCTGSLNENLICLTCGTEFCQDCEQIKKNTHKCKESDLETIKAMKEITKCPNCLLPIIRSQGCNHMTCANCGENFHYDTGEKGGSGSTNTSIELRENILLSNDYNTKLKRIHPEAITIMLKIEALNPIQTKSPPVTALNSILIKYYTNGETLQAIDKTKLSQLFEKYILHQQNITNYIRTLVELEEMLKADTLDISQLRKIYKNLM
jgi:hypothetical protein